jgi:hypothetical protein
MRYNGFITAIDMALKTIQSPLLNENRSALILGAFREDFYAIPKTDLLVTSLSFTHFYRKGLPGGFIPFLTQGARARTEFFLRRALERYRERDVTAAVAQLGRAVHPLVDMACPVHAQAVVHETDPYEWCVEAMRSELLELPLPFMQDSERAADIVETMALFTHKFEADRTNNLWGRVMKRLGKWKPVDAVRSREQARQLMPMAGACTAAFFRLFLRCIQGTSAPASHAQETLEHTLRVLDLSEGGAVRLCRNILNFCRRHNADRHYEELTRLMENCLHAAERNPMTSEPVRA